MSTMSSSDDSDTEEVMCRVFRQTRIASKQSGGPSTSSEGPSTSSGGPSTSSGGELIGDEKDIKTVCKTASWRNQKPKSKKNKKKKKKKRNGSRSAKNSNSIVEPKTVSPPPPPPPPPPKTRELAVKKFGKEKSIVGNDCVETIDRITTTTNENPHFTRIINSCMTETFMRYARYRGMDLIYLVLLVSTSCGMSWTHVKKLTLMPQTRMSWKRVTDFMKIYYDSKNSGSACLSNKLNDPQYCIQFSSFNNVLLCFMLVSVAKELAFLELTYGFI